MIVVTTTFLDEHRFCGSMLHSDFQDEQQLDEKKSSSREGSSSEEEILSSSDNEGTESRGQGKSLPAKPQQRFSRPRLFELKDGEDGEGGNSLDRNVMNRMKYDFSVFIVKPFKHISYLQAFLYVGVLCVFLDPSSIAVCFCLTYSQTTLVVIRIFTQI